MGKLLNIPDSQDLFNYHASIIMLTIGIDVGGTKISGALFSGNKELGREKIFLEIKTRDYVIESIAAIVEKLSNDKKIYAIGIGVPGSFKDGKILISPNLKCMNNTEIKKIFEKRFGTKIFVDKDANCFALGEASIRKCKNLIGLTIGTGLGGGIIIDSKIYHGIGSSGEVGHMAMLPDGKKCHCGNSGCMEQYVSGSAIEEGAEKIYGERIKPEALANLARRGDAKAQQVFEQFGKNLGICLANLNFILNPEIIVLGGGVSKCSDVFMAYTMDELRKRSFIEIPKIDISTQDGCYGASLFAARKGKNN